MHIVPFLWLVVPGEWLAGLWPGGCASLAAGQEEPWCCSTAGRDPTCAAEAVGLEVPLLHVGRDGSAWVGVLAMPKVPATPPHPLLPASVWVGWCFSTQSHFQCGWEVAKVGLL